MPIITEKYADPRWGFFNGLGAAAAAPAVPILLADPKTGKFSNERFEAAKKVLIDAMTRAWADYKKTWDAANKAGGFWKAATEKAASAMLKDSLVKNTLPRLNRFQEQLNGMFKSTDPIWNEPDKYNRFLGAIRDEIQRFQDDADTLKVAADMSFYSALQSRAKEITTTLYDAGAGLVTPILWVKYVPWILGGAVVLLVVGPTLFAGIKGGRGAAADAATADIMRARGAVAAGAKGAASLFGAPKRRVTRRRRR